MVQISVDVPQIVRDFLNKYPPSSIIKELLQNADDAQASQMHIAWTDNWPDGVHPLLNSPAILVLNDGEFTESDVRSVPILYGGSKVTAAAAIGKYGLGMKSIFHLCEGFFYVASANQPASNGNPLVDLITPWPEKDGPHDDWANTSRARDIILERLNGWRNSCDRWFCLVIPLRTQKQLAGAEAIIPKFPNVEDSLEDTSVVEMAMMVPLMRSLKRITMWDWENGSFCRKESLELEFDENGRCLFSRMGENETKSISAKFTAIAADGEESTNEMRIFGLERLLNDERFQIFKQDPGWPKSRARNRNTGKPDDANEKAEPHCAAVFVRHPSQSSTLSIDYAVFLPLAKRKFEEIELHTNHSVQLLLHGFFFLDSGRTEILLDESSDRKVETAWNRRLLETGVLPLIPQALKEFVSGAEISDEETREITRALSTSGLFSEKYKCHICSQYQWIWQLDCSDTVDGKYELLEAGKPFYEIPEPGEGGIDLLRKVFPEISELCQGLFITVAGLPCLAANGPALWAQNEEKLTQLLESVPLDVFTDGRRLGYLAQFIETEHRRSPLPDEALKNLTRKASEAITDSGMNQVRQAESAWKRLLDAIGRRHWVRLGETPEHMEPVFRKMNGCEIGSLVIPCDFAFDAGDGGQLLIKDAHRLYQWMAESEDLSKERKSTFALRILEQTSGTHEEQIRELGDFQVFLVHGATAGEHDEIRSWRELKYLHFQGRLFSPGPFLAPLQRALGNTHVYSLHAPTPSEPFQVLFEANERRPCDKPVCIDFLCKHLPDLSVPGDRADLLQRLLGPNLEPDEIKAIRYLLHGDRYHANDTNKELLAKQIGPGYAPAFSRLAHKTLCELHEEWRWVPDVLCGHLNDNQKKILSVVPVDPHHVTRLLNDMDSLQWVSEINWTEEEILTLLREIHDEALWKILPIHPTTNNERVSLDSEKCYLENPEFPISERFSGVVTLIRRHDETLLERYRRHIKDWTPETALVFALKQEHPESFAPAIMVALSQFHGPFPPGILGDLRERPWLPTSVGPRRPKDIIDLQPVENELRRLLAEPELQGAFCCALQVKEDIRDDPGFGYLRQYQILANRDESLKLLGLCLGECEEYWIGAIQAIHDFPEHVWMIIDAFEGAATEPLRVLPLLRALRRAYGNQESQELNVASQIAPGLLQPVNSIETIRACLKELADRHQVADDGRRTVCREVFDWYLEMFAKHGDFQIGNLRGLKLLSQEGNWKPPESLCVDCEGVHPDYLLDKGQADIISSVLPHPDTRAQAATEAEGEKIFDGNEIVKYLRPWEGLVPRQILGGFLAFFGDDPEILQQADAWLAPHSVQVVREWLNWEPHERVAGWLITGGGEDIHARLNIQRFRFRYGGNEGTVQVRNLLGEWFAAPIDCQVSTVFLGNLSLKGCPEENVGGRWHITLRLRQFDPHTIEPRDLREILRESARVLIRRVCGSTPNNLDRLWDRLGQTGQLPLKIAQDQILQGSWFYLPQLVSKELTPLREMLRERERLEDNQTELREDADVLDNQQMLDKSQAEIKKLNDELRHLIQEDADTQATILQAVRKKVEDFGYDADTIPFELFQNADDAAAELADMGADMHVRDRLAIQREDNVFRLLHWGRPINEFCRGGFDPGKGRKRGYNTDLKKMLILSSSDKSQREEIVTGKFGLGFKTVFLVSDCPKIISGDLAFEIVGGFYPRQMAGEEPHRLREILGQFGQERDGTLIELGLSRETERFNEGFGRFRRAAPCLLAFSRRIKELQLPERTIRWNENPIDEIAGLFVGGTGNPDPDEFDRAVVIRDRTPEHSNRAVLLPLRPDGFCRAPKDLPAFWATAPVSTDAGAGIAVNADFEVDVGRRQLADSEENRKIASEIGEVVGRALVALFNKANFDWECLRKQLRLEENTTPEKLWRSLWNLTTTDEVLKSPLLKCVLWQKGRGMARLIMGKPALPTGLETPYNGLTKLNQVRGIVHGALDKDQEILKKISAWPQFQEAYPVGNLISGQRIASKLKECDLSIPNEPQAVDLLTVLKKEFDDLLDEINPEAAGRFGEVINGKYLENLREVLSKLRFKTRAEDHWSVASDLVSACHEVEEARRAAFAPDNRVLTNEYTGKALEFFLACRERLHPPAELLAEWGLERHHTLTANQRVAFLRYLLEGDLRNEVARIIRGRKNNTWLQDVPVEFQQFDRYEQYILHGIFRIDPPPPGPTDIEQPVFPIAPRETLERIYRWWEKVRETELPIYDSRVYPDGQFPRIDPESPGKNTEKRKEWLKLFLLGMSQTIGWASPEKNREFLRQCEQIRLLDAFAEAQCGSADWMEIWYRHVDQQINEIRYFQWMKQFAGLYIIARNLNEYVDAFLAVEEIRKMFPIEGIMSPRTSAFFQGGGPDAPPASRILGIGQCFVMRELVRHDVILNKRAFPWCYVPRERVRKVIKEIGGPDLDSISQNRWYRSKAIYEFLREYLGEDRATFSSSFDIPLLAISEDEDLQMQFLRGTIRTVPEDEE